MFKELQGSMTKGQVVGEAEEIRVTMHRDSGGPGRNFVSTLSEMEDRHRVCIFKNQLFFFENAIKCTHSEVMAS